MKKGLIAGVIVIGFIALLFFAGSATSKKTSSTTQNGAAVSSAFTASETFFDFGTISMKNGKVSRMFSVANGGAAPQTIKRISTSCMCTEAFLVGQDNSKRGPFGMPGHGGAATRISETIKPGESRVVKVVFDPNAHGPAGVGLMERVVMISDENGGTLQLQIKAMVTP